MKVSLILASYDSGHYHGGMGQGPDALISGGLVDALKLAGHDVVVEDIGKVGDEQEREIATGFAVCRAVATAVHVARGKDRFPVVLAGNCLTSAGAVAGAAADAIVWADQHGDLNTPETSIYGFLDGMALAVALGLCWRPMAASIPGFQAIDPSRCVLLNARDLDPAEAVPAVVRRPRLGAADELPGPLHLHELRRIAARVGVGLAQPQPIRPAQLVFGDVRRDAEHLVGGRGERTVEHGIPQRFSLRRA